MIRRLRTFWNTSKKAEKSKRDGYVCDYAAHHALARKMAAAGAVLLKNDNGILPFAKTDKVAIIGALAETPRYQGGGSSQIHPKNLGVDSRRNE